MNFPRLNVPNTFHTEHQQIICSDGENFGLTKDTDNNDILIENEKKLKEYIVSPIKYKKDIVMEAREAINTEWLKNGSGKRYEYFGNNCQHHIKKVLNKAAEIARASQEKLILDQ